MRRHLVRIAVSLAAFVTLVGSGLDGQLIPIRTVPVASGDQFRLAPAARMGMGGVRYALRDSLADGWSNPARGGDLSSSLFLASPTFYGISDAGGAGRSFPVTGLFAGSRWFGGASVALQQVENDPTRDGWFRPAFDVVCCCDPCWAPNGGGNSLSDRLGRNLYASGFVGTRLGEGPWTVGVGLGGASLQAMDGVDLLYAGSDRIEQSGQIVDIRLGLDRVGETDRLGIVLVNNRVSMEHDVTWTRWVQIDSMQGQWERTVELNEDKTRSWAGQVMWERDLRAPGWRIGASATVNQKSHPKIPNYVIQNIPRDPGTTWAWEAGFGVARTAEATTFGLDIALQPIWSTTWQGADSVDVANSGGRLSIGDRSIENDFMFTNVMLRSGLSHRINPVEFQIGLDIRSYGYVLDQVNWVEATQRNQTESWVEWSPTVGIIATLDALDIRYGLRVTNGTGRPGLANSAGPGDQLVGAEASDFLLAPGAPLTLEDARVTTHQITVSIPIR